MNTTETELGQVLRDGERVGLRFVRRYPHPVERVWSALTDSDQLRHWMPCDIVGRRCAGAEITLPFWPDQVAKHQLEQTSYPGRIEVWDPPEVFEWLWGGDRLRFELEPAENGTTLTFTTWLENHDLREAAGVAGGYHLCLDQLRLLVGAGEMPLLTDRDDEAHALEPTYRERLERG
ncbi:MAG TPA: SRPBCC domain-containing protein [Propionibacteriaceae bacterium]